MAPAAAVKHYTVERSSAGPSEGRYASKSGPAAAAKKAASKRLPKKDGATMTLTIRELGSDRVFSYTATRKKLAKPVERVIAGKNVVTRFETVVKATKAGQAKKLKAKGGGTDVAIYRTPEQRRAQLGRGDCLDGEEPQMPNDTAYMEGYNEMKFYNNYYMQDPRRKPPIDFYYADESIEKFLPKLSEHADDIRKGKLLELYDMSPLYPQNANTKPHAKPPKDRGPWR